MTLVREGVANIWIAPLAGAVPDGRLIQRTFEKESGAIPAWSANGQWVAYQCSAAAATHICVVPAADGERQELTSDAGQGWVGGWLPDSERVLFAAQREAVWNVAWVSRVTKEVRTLTHFTNPRAYVRYPAWDAVSHRVVFERSETTGRIWTVELPAR